LGSHTLIGSGQFTLDELVSLGLRKVRIVNQKKMRTKGYFDSGVFDIVDIRVKQEHTFLDYIAGGCQIALVAAVDFTASNGHPSNP
jgi:hypothetical protein